MAGGSLKTPEGKGKPSGVDLAVPGRGVYMECQQPTPVSRLCRLSCKACVFEASGFPYNPNFLGPFRRWGDLVRYR